MTDADPLVPETEVAQKDDRPRGTRHRRKPSLPWSNASDRRSGESSVISYGACRAKPHRSAESPQPRFAVIYLRWSTQGPRTAAAELEA
jgi:hypothetical protein